MPFALLTIGMLLIITGFQNTYKELGTQLQKDFSGEGNFLYWVVAIGIVGSIGYIKSMETFSRAFMAMIIIAIFISKGGQEFFGKFTEQLKAGSTSEVNPVGAPIAGGAGGGGGGGDSGGGFGDFGNILSTAATVASFF